MEFPDDLRYTKEHEWVKVTGHVAVIGITDFAQEQLGDIVFVELPAVGEELKEGETFGAVESVKSVSDCFSPISGKVLDVNDSLTESPEILNEDCYGEGWMLKVKIEDENALEEMMSAEEYEAFIKEETA